MSKYAVFILAACLFVQQVSAQQALQIDPAAPRPGQSFAITYDPSSTALNGEPGISAVAYLMEGGLPIAMDLPLQRQGNHYIGKVQTRDTSLSVFFVFSAGDKKDNNGTKGYYVLMHDASGNAAPGAGMAAGQAFLNFGGLWGLDRNADLGFQLMKDDFTAHPSLRKKFPQGYLNMLGQSKDSADKKLLRQELTQVLRNPGSSEADLSSVQFTADRILKDKAMSEEASKLIRQRFPDGMWKRNESVMAINAEKDIAKKEILFRDFLKKYPPVTAQDSSRIEFFASIFAAEYVKQGNPQMAETYIAHVRNKQSLSSMYNSIAWREAGEGIEGKPGDIAAGLRLSEQSLQLAREEIRSPSNAPVFYTPSQWTKQLYDSYITYADTYALLLYRDGQYDKALAYQREAFVHTKGKNKSTNEPFTIYLEKSRGADSARMVLERLIRDGYYTPGMKNQYKRLYLAKPHTEAEWTTHITALERTQLEEKRRALENKMIREAAPAFTLKDMEGKNVSLASLKGKVVVVDFWATWCGPCIQSFPGMKKAQEKYAADADVKFLFVDTWENGESDKKLKGAEDFMKKNGYPFHVLMDYEDAVVQQYKVDGIPTKFVIDKKGQIRFKSIGYEGNTDALAEELSWMIDMAKKAD
jgi:thiol-disulfide isomerase/thioredoxin